MDVGASKHFLLAVFAGVFLTILGCRHDDPEPQLPTPSAPPQNPPRVVGDRVQVADASSITLRPLGNDSDPDGDALTLTVVEPPLVGTAIVNADNSVTLAGLEQDFRGLNRFRYRATDARGASADAYVVIFVATPPFRGLFVRGPITDRKIMVTDFGAPARAMPWGSAGAPIVKFVPAEDGSVIAFATPSPTSGMQDVCTASPDSTAAPVCHAYLQTFPGSAVQFSLSENGDWLAVEGASVWLRNLSAPGALPVELPIEDATDVRFSANGEHLYLRGRAREDEVGRHGVYRVTLSPPYAQQLITALVGPSSSVSTFAVSPDESRMVIHRINDDAGFWLLDPDVPGVEQRLDNVDARALFTPTSWQRMVNPEVTSLAYVTTLGTPSPPPQAYYLADVSQTPNPRSVSPVSSGDSLVWSPMVRPDGHAVLARVARLLPGPPPGRALDLSSEYVEAPDSHLSIAAPRAPFYDSTGDYLLGYYSEASPPQSTFTISHRIRGSVTFPASDIEGITHSATPYERRPAVLLGRSPTIPTPGNPSRLELVNFAAPAARLVLDNNEWNPGDHTGSWLFLVDATL